MVVNRQSITIDQFKSDTTFFYYVIYQTREGVFYRI